jgi:hypothetical protein
MSGLGKSNRHGEYKTWHFTGMLTPTPEITRIFSWYAHESQHTDKTRGPIMVVRNWMEQIILNGKPDCITFISLRFSRTDVATWLSNATARSPLLDLHYEGYVQSTGVSIALHRLNRWIPHVIWNHVGGMLSRCAEFNLFCEANEIYEYWNSGSLAANRGGRPPTGAKPSVRPAR